MSSTKIECLHDYKTDTEYQLMSKPPQFRQECKKCGEINFIFCSDYELLHVPSDGGSNE